MEYEKLLEKLVQQGKELEKLRGYTGADEIIPLASLEFNDKPCAFKSKFPTLDILTDGLEPGELIVISGLTKNGKTTFSVNLTENFASQGIESLWFSYEMPYRQFRKMFSEKIPQTIFVPLSLRNSTLLWIKSKILEGILKFGVKAVFIDHLGFLQDLVQKQDRRIEIDTIIREIKQMAIELNITIFLIHHIKKIESGQIPHFEDLKESSAIAQDSDKVWMIWRDFVRSRRGELEMTGLTKFSVELDRQNGAYKKSFTLIFKNNKFQEYNEKQNPDTYQITSRTETCREL